MRRNSRVSLIFAVFAEEQTTVKCAVKSALQLSRCVHSVIATEAVWEYGMRAPDYETRVGW